MWVWDKYIFHASSFLRKVMNHIKLSDNAYLDIAISVALYGFLFIRETTYRWIFAISNKFAQIINHWEIKRHRMISFYSAGFKNIFAY